MKVVLAIDAGTTGNRVIAFGPERQIVAQSYYEFPQFHPQPGWVEQDAWDIWSTTRRALGDVLSRVGAENVYCIGITNQRETVILWDRNTGKPVYNAIVWQCRRTATEVKRLEDAGALPLVRQKTGLLLDPYFSASKIRWILDNVPDIERRAVAGEICCGTVDSWILHQLTAGRIHATDASNASRTLCYNIHNGQYDLALLELFGVPDNILPEVRASNATFSVSSAAVTGVEIPITGILGDQQAALFGNGGWERGVVKNTYGTGLFLMACTGDQVAHSESLLSTVAWKIDATQQFALEGSVFMGGAAVQWLRDGLGIIASAADSDELAQSVVDNGDVYFVPALAGLGAPYWDSRARGVLVGLTQGTGRAHIVRATLEALAYQTKDVVEAMRLADGGPEIVRLRVDGGAAANDFLMQFQADILGIPVERPQQLESTAAGVAGLAGIAAGFWTKDVFMAGRRVEHVFEPRLACATRERLYARWLEAIERAREWLPAE